MTSEVAGSKSESCEAYVCAIRKNAGVQVYVALVADNKRIFVYTRAEKPDTEEGYDLTLQEALDFTRSMGFTPELVNLNYSAAMREVVVRNIKILRPPGSVVNALLKHGMADAPTPPGAKRPSPLAKHSPGALPATSPAASLAPHLTSPSAGSQAAKAMATPPVTAAVQPSSDEELAVLRGALSRMTDENRKLQKRASQEVASLREKLMRGLSDSEREREQLAAVRAELLKEQNAQETAYAEALSSLKGELETISAVRDAQTVTVQERSVHLAAAAELAAAREDRSRLTSERDALALRIEAIEATSSDLAALQREVAAISEQRDEANRRELMLAAESAARANAFMGAHKEIANLILERDAAQKRAEELAAENGTSVTEREALHAEIPALSAQRQEALLRAESLEKEGAARAAELEVLRAEIAALAAEREMLKQQVRELSFVGQTMDAAPVTARLRTEDAQSRQLLEGFASPSAGNLAEFAKQRLELPEVTVPSQTKAETDRHAAAVSTGKLQELPIFSDVDDDFFPSGELESYPGRFLLQSGLTAIEYAAPDDIVELHQSINLAHLSPEGKGQENCQGYICCLRRDGAWLVFAALFGVKSGRTWVYLPEVQPGDEPAYASAVRGAISFAEDVGFIMEPVDLGAAHQQPSEAVMRCPVLRCAERK
jgi:hypothetical protein